MSITVSIPVMPFKVQIRRPTDSEPTLMEKAVLLWLLGQGEVAFEDVAEFLNVGRRIAFDIVSGLWRRSLIIVDLQGTTLSLAPHVIPMVQQDNWQNLRDPNGKFTTVSLLVELVNGGILPDPDDKTSGLVPKSDSLSAAAPVILEYDAYRSVNQSSLYWALQREPEYRKLTKGVIGGSLYVTPPENYAANGERLLWVDMEFTAESFGGGEIRLIPSLGDHSLRPVYSGIARRLEAWIRTHPDEKSAKAISDKAEPVQTAENEQSRESAFQLFTEKLGSLSAEDRPADVHNALIAMWPNVQAEYDTAKRRSVSARPLAGTRAILNALEENLRGDFSQCLIVSPTLDPNRVNALYPQLEALLDDRSRPNRSVVIITGREGVSPDLGAREMLRRLRAEGARNLHVSSRPANFEGSFALFDEKVLLVSSHPLLGREVNVSVGAELTSRSFCNDSLRELVRYCDKASSPGVVRVKAAEGKQEGLACDREIQIPEVLEGVAEEYQPWPLIFSDWRGVAKIAEDRFSAVPDHVRILTEGEIYLETLELVRSTPPADDLTIAIGRLPGSGLDAQWVHAVKERCRQGGRTVLRFSANFENARIVMNELADEFPGKIDCRQIPQLFGCYVASSKAVIMAVEGMAAPLYRNLMRGTPFAFGFLVRGKCVGINFTRSMQSLLQLPDGKWRDDTPDREPPPTSGASTIHRQWHVSLDSDGPVAALGTLVNQLKAKPHLLPVLDAARAEIGDPALDLAVLKAGALCGVDERLYDLAEAYWRQGKMVEAVLVSTAAQERNGRAFLPPHLLKFAWLVGHGREEDEDVVLPDATSSEAEVRACWALAAISLLRGTGRWCLGGRFQNAPIQPDFEPLTDLVRSASNRAYNNPDSAFPYRELAQIDAMGDLSSLRGAICEQMTRIRQKKFKTVGVSRRVEKMMSADMPLGRLSKCLSMVSWQNDLPDSVDADLLACRGNMIAYARSLVRRIDTDFDAGTEQFVAKMFIEPLRNTVELFDRLTALGPLLTGIRPEDPEVWKMTTHYLHQREENPPPDDLAFPIEDCLRTMITDWRRGHGKR